MSIIVCPNCRRSYPVASSNDDFICSCADLNANQFEAFEDKLKIGTFSEFGGTGGVQTDRDWETTNKIIVT